MKFRGQHRWILKDTFGEFLWTFCLQELHFLATQEFTLRKCPLFLKIGHPAFWKLGHYLFNKKRDQAASFFWITLTLFFFSLWYFQKAGCPICKNSGCRLTSVLENSLSKRSLHLFFVSVSVSDLRLNDSTIDDIDFT